MRGQPNEVGRLQQIHPGRVEGDLGFRRIENLEYLRLIGLGVLEDLLTRQRRTCRTLAARIADHPGKITDQENDLVTQILKLAKLVNKHSVPEMQVRRRWIETRLDPQRRAFLELGNQLGFDEHFLSAPLDHCQLLFNRLHSVAPHQKVKGGNLTRSPEKYNAPRRAPLGGRHIPRVASGQL